MKHIVRDCLKSKTIKMNKIVKEVKFDENSKKKMVFIEIAIKKMITMSFMNLNLVDSNSTIVKCILKDKYEIKIIIDSDSNDYKSGCLSGQNGIWLFSSVSKSKRNQFWNSRFEIETKRNCYL